MTKDEGGTKVPTHADRLQPYSYSSFVIRHSSFQMGVVMSIRSVTMEQIVSLCKRRGFVYPSAEIYGGFANAWDYGPLGVEMKRNIREQWWGAMVRERDDIVGIEAAIITNPKVWVASGHVESFNDPLVECRNCHNRFRADN